jgi:hypothetical protein
MKRSPLAGTGWSSSVVAISMAYDVDPRALVAIAWAETNLGRASHPLNNYWGLGPGRSYSTAAGGITVAAATLDRMIDSGLTSVNQLYGGQAGAWRYDAPGTPEANKCVNRGAPTVRHEMARLGADPNNLRFPEWCKDE